MSIPLFAGPGLHGRVPRPVWTRRVMACAAAALVAGCGGAPSWDREYVCEGQESSVSQFKGASAVRQSYPLSLDLHVRDPYVFVKGTTSDLRSRRDGDTHFAVRSASFWMAGGFDEPTGILTLVEERTLTLAGQEQLVRTSGTYRCHRQGAVARLGVVASSRQN